MNQQAEDLAGSTSVECPSCGSNHVSEANEIEHFQYGDKENAQILSVLISVHHCASCGFSFTTEDASELKHDAVCRHLGVMTPNEVRGVRERYGLSQADFAELSKIGKASLARWESGSLIQNQANDNFLYLLTYEDNFKRLRDRTRLPDGVGGSIANVVPFRPKFRSLPQSDMERLQLEAKRFVLFPVAAHG